MKRQSGLGRGLDALFDLPASEAGQSVRELPIGDIDTNPAQPRRAFDEDRLNELTQSVMRHGVLQPIIVSPEGDRYRIVAGERRFRAARIAGLMTIPAVIRDMEEAQRQEIALIENLQREDLNPIEEAEGVATLIQTYDLTQEEAADRLSRSRPAVTNALRLLSLDPRVRALVRDGALSAGHARALIPLKPEEQLALAEEAVAKGLSVRALEKRAKNPTRKARAEKECDMDETERAHLQEKMRDTLGTRVRLDGDRNRGKITIEYMSRDELERLYAFLTGGLEDG